MNRLAWKILLSLVVSFVPSAVLLGDEEPAKPAAEPTAAPEAEKPAPPATVKVTAEPFRQTIELDGVFAPANAAEFMLQVEEATDLTVAWVVPAGTKVAAGEPLLRLKTEAIDRQINEMQAGFAVAKLMFEQTERLVEMAGRADELAMTDAERTAQIAREDLDRFVQQDRKQAEQSAQDSVKRVAQQLQYEQEELKQLERMYAADELTEETEEIVSVRARNSVEASQRYFELAKLGCDQTLQIELPRQLQMLETAAKQAELALQRAKLEIPVAAEKRKIDLQKQQFDLAVQEQKLQKIVAERQKFEVRSPGNGVVFYGQTTRGKWNSASMESKLKPGGSVESNEVLMTIVQPPALKVFVTAGEKEVLQLQVGMAGSIRPAALPEKKLPLVLRAFSAVPYDEGKYEGVLSVEEESQIQPGMTGKVEIVTYVNNEAIVVPASAVFTEKETDRKYVWKAVADGKPEKIFVCVGRTSGERVELIDGPPAGAELLTTEPTEE